MASPADDRRGASAVVRRAIQVVVGMLEWLEVRLDVGCDKKLVY